MKEIRAEQEKKLNQQKKEEEEKLRKEENEKKAKEAEEKKKRLEEAEAKRQEMLEAQKADKQSGAGNKKSGSAAGGDARREMTKTKEQLEEEKKLALSIRIKPLDLDSMDSDELKDKAKELFNIVIALETDKYDYEQRRITQDYELNELKERQKAQLRQKALKKGLDPEAFVGKYPPMIRMYSKYERRTDTRTYDDRKKLYEGGWEVIRAESLDAIWKEKYEEWSKRPAKKLPKWFVRDLARKLEMLKPQRVRKKAVRKQLQRRKTMKKKRRRKKKRKRRKSKHYSRKPFLICNVWPDFSSQQIPDEHSCQEQSSLSMKMDSKSNEGQRLLVFDLSFVVICDFPVAT